MGSYEFLHGDGHTFDATAGAAKTAGQPDVLGVSELPIVWLKDVANTKVGPVACKGKFYLDVHGYGEAAGEAVSAGDKIYLDGSELNKDETNGKFFGIALGAVASDATTTIEVLIGVVPGVDVA